MGPWLGVTLWIVLGCLAAVSARSRGRSPLTWFFVGILLGWYGLLLLYILPVIQAQEEAPKRSSEPPVAGPGPAPDPMSDLDGTQGWFFLDHAKTVCGPITATMLRTKWHEGQLFPESWVWNDLIVSWKKISQVPPLLNWLQSSSAPLSKTCSFLIKDHQ